MSPGFENRLKSKGDIGEVLFPTWDVAMVSFWQVLTPRMGGWIM